MRTIQRLCVAIACRFVSPFVRVVLLVPTARSICNKPTQITIKRSAPVALAVLLSIGVSAPVWSAPITFFDDFNRPNGVVGNGWINTTGNVGGNLVIQSGALSTPGPDGVAGIYRPIDFSAPVTVSGTITQQNGFGGLLRRYDTSLLFGGNGSRSSGYGVEFGRSDQNYANSTVNLVLNGAYLATISSTFQFGASITPSITFNPSNGTIAGTVTGSGSAFNFNFGPRSVALPGLDFSINQGFPDGRSNAITNPTLDNLSLSYGSALPLRTYTPNIPVPTAAPPTGTFPAQQRVLIDTQTFVANNQGRMDPVARQMIQQQILTLQAQSSAYQPLSQVWKDALHLGADTLSVSLGGATAVADALSFLGVGGFSTAERILGLASVTNTLVGFLPNSNQSLANAQLGASFLSSIQGAAQAGTSVGALFYGDLFLWGSLIPRLANSLAADPPALNYTVPISVALPILRPIIGTGLPSLDEFLTSFNDVTERTAFYMQAVSASADRYGAALNAGDNISALLQLEATLDYLRLLGGSLREADAVFAQLPAMLALAGLSNPQGDFSVFQNTQASLMATGLPSDLTDLLSADGFTSTDIGNFTFDLTHFDLSRLSMGPHLFDASFLAAQSLDSISGPRVASVPEPGTLWLLFSLLPAILLAKKNVSARDDRCHLSLPPVPAAEAVG